MRIVEAYIGEYASGKSENAINRALDLAERGHQVTLGDLDLVEPFYTLRPLKKELSSLGINIITEETRDTMGLGEAGTLMRPELKFILKQAGDIIIDVGYGVEGAKIFNLLHGYKEEQDFRIIAVLNTNRPMTSQVKDIVEYVRSLGKVDYLLNNTHLGEETDVQTIQSGAKIVKAAADELGITMLGTAALERFREALGAKDIVGCPIRYLKRFMHKAFW